MEPDHLPPEVHKLLVYFLQAKPHFQGGDVYTIMLITCSTPLGKTMKELGNWFKETNFDNGRSTAKWRPQYWSGGYCSPQTTLLDLVLHRLYLPSGTNDHVHFPFVLCLRAFPFCTISTDIPPLYRAYGHFQDPIMQFFEARYLFVTYRSQYECKPPLHTSCTCRHIIS